MSPVSLPIAMTMGDPAGIGPELALRAWLARRQFQAPFFVFGNAGALRGLSMRLGLSVPVHSTAAAKAGEGFDDALPVVELRSFFNAQPGQPDPANAAATIESIERAVSAVHEGHAGAIVTNPIAKHVLYDSGFHFPGHTEFLGALAGAWGGQPAQPVMMLWSRDLAVAPVTVHIPLCDVPRSLTFDLIVSTARIVARDMSLLFKISHPRLAIAGLNPHAGEAGAIGREEITIIAPAIAQLRKEGLRVSGPHPADTLFHAAARTRYDVAIAMYHDQALIPIKTLAFDTGVNVTLGLPFVRTSPDHGVAFDIAGKGLANPASLIEAVKLAARLAAP
jgi:4-hydroxythreonine-4-phosphate dehydrogenase